MGRRRRQELLPLVRLLSLVGLLQVLGLVRTSAPHRHALAWAPGLANGRGDSASGPRRATWLGGLLLMGHVSAGRPAPAQAEVAKLLDKSLHRYSKQLQRHADVLVFEARPLIQQGNWTGLGELFRADAYPNDVLHTVEFIVTGNEDFLPGTEDVSARLDVSLRDMGSQLSSEARSQERALKAWDDIAAALNSVMSSANTLLAEEPELKDIPAFARDISGFEEEQRSMTQPVLLQGRQGSRTSLCPGSMPQANAPPMAVPGNGAPPPHTGGVTVMTMQGSMQQQPPPVTVISTTQSMVQGHDPRRPSCGQNEPPVRRGCSPTRQFSAGLHPVSTSLRAEGVACSPPMLPRTSAALEQKSPVRRFISAGLSPRVQDALAPSQGWASISQATLIR